MTDTTVDIITQGQVKAEIIPAPETIIEVTTNKVIAEVPETDPFNVEITTNQFVAEVTEPAVIVPEISTNSQIDVEILSITNQGADLSDEVYTAGENIGINKFVYIANSGKAFIAGNDIPASRGLVRGITISAAGIGEQIKVRRTGTIINSAWTWGTSGILYLQTNGDIGIVPPATAGNYIQPVAIIKSSMVILLSIDDTTIGI